MDFPDSSSSAAPRQIGSFSPDVVDTVRTSLSVSAGATVVMTTHDPDHRARLSGGSIVLEGGKVSHADL